MQPIQVKLLEDYGGLLKGHVLTLKTLREVNGAKKRPDVFSFDLSAAPPQTAAADDSAQPAVEATTTEDAPVRTTRRRRRPAKGS